jgi:hypothetical protein
MNSYIDISLIYRGKKYPAKLFGDKIVSELCNLNISRSDISKYKVNYFKRKILLYFNHNSVLVNYHDKLIRWFDPLFKIRLLIVGSFMALPVLTVFTIAGVNTGISRLLPLLLVSLGISLVSGSLASYFFRLARLSAEHLYIKIFFLLLIVCVPVMYWYPFSVYIMAGGAGLFGLFTFGQYIFTNSFNVYKYYLSLTWILLMIFLYFWIISILKLSMDYNMYKTSRGVIRESDDRSAYAYGNMIWEKPVDWKISQYNFLQTVVKRRDLLWQFSPLPVLQKISTPETHDFGWIAVSNQPPAETLVQMNQYLEMQKNLLPADLLEKSAPVEESSSIGQVAFQSFTYYDMIERKVSLINVLLIPVIDDLNDHSQGTMIFAFKIPENASVNYYLDLIKSGFKKRKETSIY